ncbi:unnamed protein product [Mytilus edulis]|uniref:Uncharacterized protein n=1 Tax=Mytilus edulis TaxID=6550 RepID=A0A8S3TZY0_MYTED|nr:unnamed protein product [Mytilus edulis]
MENVSRVEKRGGKENIGILCRDVKCKQSRKEEGKKTLVYYLEMENVSRVEKRRERNIEMGKCNQSRKEEGKKTSVYYVEMGKCKQSRKEEGKKTSKRGGKKTCIIRDGKCNRVERRRKENISMLSRGKENVSRVEKRRERNIGKIIVGGKLLCRDVKCNRPEGKKTSIILCRDGKKMENVSKGGKENIVYYRKSKLEGKKTSVYYVGWKMR